MLVFYTPTEYRSVEPLVSITATEFRFNVSASRLTGWDAAEWCFVALDSDTRSVVFVGASADTKPDGALRIGRSKGGGGRAIYRSITAKGLIRGTQWLRTVAHLPTQQRKFLLTKFEGTLPTIPQQPDGRKVRTVEAWRIDVCPAFEHYIEPHDIDKLEHEAAGIYRYRNERGEIIYIGSGKIRDRFEAPERKTWRIARIEYSLVADRQRAYQWERYWHDQFEGEFGRLPAFNLATAPDFDGSA